MKSVVETYTCDMCGERFDVNTSRHDCVTNTRIVVHEHNPIYDEGYQDGIAFAQIDLCPKCADRACAIHHEWHKDSDGVWHTTLSWRDHVGHVQQ